MGELAPPLQQGGWRALVIAAVVCGVARIALEDWAVHRSGRAGAILAATRDRWSGISDRGAAWRTVSEPMRIAIVSVGTLLLLAGILDGVLETITALLLIVVVQLVRYWLYRYTPAVWLKVLLQVPAAVRLAIGIAFGYLLLNRLLVTLSQTGGEPAYGVLLQSILFMMLVFALLFPARSRASGRSQGR